MFLALVLKNIYTNIIYFRKKLNIRFGDSPRKIIEQVNAIRVYTNERQLTNKTT